MKNNQTRYITYAFGEIILVVLGILIALQISQWNDDRKANIALQLLIQNLNEEFQDNYVQLEIDLERLIRTITASQTLLIHTGPQSTGLNEISVDSLIFEALEIPTWNPSSFVLKDIKNSGKLSTLNSQKLKKQLFEWERTYEDILERHQILDKFGADLTRFISENGSLINVDNYENLTENSSKFSINNVRLLKDIRFENYLENKLYTSFGLENKYNLAKKQIEEILERSKVAPENKNSQ